MQHPQEYSTIVRVIGNIIVFPLYVYSRFKAIKSENRYQKQLKLTYKTILKEYQRSIENNVVPMVYIYNISLYIIMIEKDMSIIRRYIYNTNNMSKHNFLMRQMVMIMYEFCYDLPEMLGKKFRDYLGELNMTKDEWKFINNTKKEIDKFKNDNSEYLSKIRNYVVAHRDHKVIEQIQIIDGLDHHKIIVLIGDIEDVVRKTINMLTFITNKYNDQKVLLRYIIKKYEEIDVGK